MKSNLSPERVTHALEKSSQLRTLFHRLPHVPTPAEQRLLAEFEVRGRERAESCSDAALRAGFRQCWRRRDYETIAEAVTRLDPERLETEPTLALFAHLARRAIESRGR